jgi:hypothetical protein
MRKTLLALSALAAVAITASSTTRTEASPLVNPAGLSGAVDELGLVDNVHCRPGWRHHNPNRWRRADGCARRGADVYVVPGRSRYVIRDGVRVRVGGDGVRSRTTIRSGDQTTIRSRTNVRTNVNVREGRGRDGGGNVNVRQRGGGTTVGGGGTRQERGGGAMQDRGGGGSKQGGGAVQKGGGGTQQKGGGQGGQSQ